MDRFKNLMLTAAAVVILAMVISATGLGHAVAQTASGVLVVNSSSQAVPVIVSGQTQVIYRSPDDGFVVNHQCSPTHTVNVAAYSRIRVYFAVSQRSGSVPRTELDLWPAVGPQYSRVALLGSLVLQGLDRRSGGANNPVTAAYDVPGQDIGMAVCSNGLVTAGMWMYGTR